MKVLIEGYSYDPAVVKNILPEKKDFVPSSFKSIGKKTKRGPRRR